MQMVGDGVALAVEGNHEDKLARALRGNNVQVSPGLARSLQQIDAAPDAPALREALVAFIQSMPDHLRLDEGRLIAVHAGLPEGMHGRVSRAVRAFALYGDTTGALDANGNPVRRDWAASYRGEPLVVYGHTPTDDPMFRHETICIDTGCVFGGRLTALRYPEREILTVAAPGRYYPVPAAG
jgi:protein phosphatase